MSRHVTQGMAGRLAVLALSVAALLAFAPALAQAAQVSGRITSDTTWTAGSWQLTGDVEVAHGVTLAIEPGASVAGAGHTLAVFGDLHAEGTTGTPVVLRSVRLRGRGSFVLPSTLETYAIDVEHADIDGGDLQGGDETSYGSWVLRDSIVSNVDQAMYLWYPRADCFVERNVFLNAGKITCGLLYADAYVRDNVFWRSDFSAPAHDSVVTNWTAVGHSMFVNGNSFLNPGRLAAALDLGNSSGAIDASGNWWGVPPSQTATIAAMVYDRTVDLRLPSVIDTSGALGSPSASAPGSRLPLAVSVASGRSRLGVASGAKVAVSATFSETGRKVPARVNVELARSSTGTTWTRVASGRTGADGKATFTVLGGFLQHYRISIVQAAGVFASATSGDMLVAAKPSLSAPKAPVSVRRNRLFTIWGTLKTRHPAGSKTVTLFVYHSEKGRWKLRAKVVAIAANYGAASKYTARLKLTRTGAYRVRARCVDPKVVAVTSAYGKFRVK